MYTHTLSLSLSLSHCILIFMAIILAFSPMHLLELLLCQEESHPFQILFIPPQVKKVGFGRGGSIYIYTNIYIYIYIYIHVCPGAVHITTQTQAHTGTFCASPAV